MNTVVDIDFSRGKWDKSKWLLFKSRRFDYIHGFKQEDDHIVNESPEGISDEELYAKHVTEVYSSMIYPERFSGVVEVSSTMSWDHLMAPIIVITPELDKDERGNYSFAKHYEVVAYADGVNIWHYRWRNGKPDWHLAAFGRKKLSPKTRYELKVKMQKAKDEMRMTVECGGLVVGFEDAELPESFYAGITGCEGRNRFYDFKVKTSDEAFDPSKDGEH